MRPTATPTATAPVTAPVTAPITAPTTGPGAQAGATDAGHAAQAAAALRVQADELAAALAGRGAEIEARGHLPPDIAQALAERGLLRLLTPAEIGGHELPVADYFGIIERLAMADASVAWCCFISCTSSLLAAWLPADAARALFGAPLTKAAGVFAPRGQARAAVVDGVAGWRVSGRWPWGSGARHADVLSAGCLVIGDDGRPETVAGAAGAAAADARPGRAPRVLSVVLPRQQVTVHDNWTAMGLGGTGSGEFEVQDVFVPAAHATSLMDAPRLATPLYRFPVFGLLALSIAAVASGIARQALDDLQTLSGSKLPQGSTRVLAQRPATQEAVARAEAQWRSARAYVMQAVATAWAAASAGGDLPLALRADLRLAATHAVHGAAAVVDRMFTLGGGHAVFADSPLQRHLRNIHVANQHMMVAEATYELVGRVQLGLPTEAGML